MLSSSRPIDLFSTSPRAPDQAPSADCTEALYFVEARVRRLPTRGRLTPKHHTLTRRIARSGSP